VIWTAKNLHIPAELSDIQYSDPGYPGEYIDKDLERMISWGEAIALDKFVHVFADRLAEALDTGTLQPAPSMDYYSIPSAWHGRGSQPAATSPAAGARRPDADRRRSRPSPPGKSVIAVCVVPGPAELERVRSPERLRSCYNDDPRFWRAFLPPEDREAGLLLQEIATHERMFCDWVTFDGDLKGIVEQAEKEKKIVVILVDPWVIHLPRFVAAIREFDRTNYLNCTVLVLLNKDDEENQTKRDELLAELKELFYHRSRFDVSELYYKAPITSREEFDLWLRQALQKRAYAIINVRSYAAGSGPPTF
jgi:FxsC-like protein